jgi:hypothetical protein
MNIELFSFFSYFVAGYCGSQSVGTFRLKGQSREILMAFL